MSTTSLGLSQQHTQHDITVDAVIYNTTIVNIFLNVIMTYIATSRCTGATAALPDCVGRVAEQPRRRGVWQTPLGCSNYQWQADLTFVIKEVDMTFVINNADNPNYPIMMAFTSTNAAQSHPQESRTNPQAQHSACNTIISSMSPTTLLTIVETIHNSSPSWTSSC